MRHWVLFLAVLGLAGCASDGYRYHDDGYWSATAPPRSGLVIHGSVSSCWGWHGPAAFTYFGPWSSPCSPLFYGYNYGNGWYGGGSGYDYGSYWNHPWYWPRRANDVSAGTRAREMAAQLDRPAQPGDYPRYDELAPMRRRDTGGGDRAFQSQMRYYAPEGMAPRQPGFGSLGSRGNGDRSGNSRAGLSSRSMDAPSMAPRSNDSARTANPREREEN